MSFRAIAVAAALICCCPNLSGAAAISMKGENILQRSKEIVRQLDEFYLAQKLEAERTYDVKDPFNGTVLIAVGDQVVYERGFGYANREWGITTTLDTKFEIWSVTKTFTAIAVMQLRERGKLRLDEPICGRLMKYLPACPPAWQPITIHHLLTHSSGLPELNQSESGALGFGEFGQDDCNRCRLSVTPEEVIAIHRDKRMSFAPGEAWLYSNIGYYLLGLIIEQASGKSYENALRELIFQPLKMHDTGIADDRIISKRASKYQQDVESRNRLWAYIEAPNPGQAAPRVRLVQAEYQDLSWIFSAGALYSTTEDMLKLSLGLQSGILLPAAALESMRVPSLLPYHMPAGTDDAVAEALRKERSQYGMGWQTNPIPGRRCYGHAGAGKATSAQFVYCPDQKLTFVILNGYGNPNVFDIVFGSKAVELDSR